MDTHADMCSRTKLANLKCTTRVATKSLVDPNPYSPAKSDSQNSDSGESSADSPQTIIMQAKVNDLSKKLSKELGSLDISDSDESPPHSLIDVSNNESNFEDMADATASYIQEKWNQPLSLTTGPGLSSILLESFFTATNNAFEQINTPNADCTKTVANRILHPKIVTWYALNHAEINALEWNTYKKKVCSITLGADWDTKERCTLKLTAQATTEFFSSFFDHVNFANTPLSSTSKHFSQAELRALLTHSLNGCFHTYMKPHLEDAATVEDFYKWHDFMVKKQLLTRLTPTPTVPMANAFTVLPLAITLAAPTCPSPTVPSALTWTPAPTKRMSEQFP
jgi:hypothetical protein